MNIKLSQTCTLVFFSVMPFAVTACFNKVAGAGMAKYATASSVDTTCQAYTDFISGDGTGAIPPIQTLIYNSCQTCHNTNAGAGSAMYLITGPNPTDDQSVANYIQAQGRMVFADGADVSQSDLIQYGRGYKTHTGGAAFSVDDELVLTNWAADLAACSANASPTPDPSTGI